MNYCSGHCQIGHQFDSARDVMATLARLGNDDGLSENPPCCTPTAYRSLKVHFRTPNAPVSRYNMNYCSGHCQIGHQFDSARDVMATLARLGNDDGLSENPPCCTPTAYRSLKITYTTGFGIYRERVLRDIIVKECGCRQ
uniref:TGF_BETA_2 domain-containing protein n=1 Tax=Ascaris lumbricoides TaxID=6252 RepID=A0A0M3IT18_ASCLU